MTDKAGDMSLFRNMFLIFLTLKLCEIIDWSWWLVTAPIWGLFIFGFLGNIALQIWKNRKK